MGRVRGKDWMQEHVADRYVKRARAEGMRSRAAYKLAQIADRDRLLKPGMFVVDLGAAPESGRRCRRTRGREGGWWRSKCWTGPRCGCDGDPRRFSDVSV